MLVFRGVSFLIIAAGWGYLVFSVRLTHILHHECEAHSHLSY